MELLITSYNKFNSFD